MQGAPRPRAPAAPAHSTGRALNRGMAAISSASTTSRGLNRGGRTRRLVANRGDCGTVSPPPCRAAGLAPLEPAAPAEPPAPACASVLLPGRRPSKAAMRSAVDL